MKLKHKQARDHIAVILSSEPDGLPTRTIVERLKIRTKMVPHPASLSNLLFRDSRFVKVMVGRTTLWRLRDEEV